MAAVCAGAVHGGRSGDGWAGEGEIEDACPCTLQEPVARERDSLPLSCAIAPAATAHSPPVRRSPHVLGPGPARILSLGRARPVPPPTAACAPLDSPAVALAPPAGPAFDCRTRVAHLPGRVPVPRLSHAHRSQDGTTCDGIRQDGGHGRTAV